MEIMVVRRNGTKERIVLKTPLTVKEYGTDAVYSGVLISGEGTRHYFNRNGTYDGWELNVEQQDLSIDEAKQLVSTIETQRKKLA